MRKRSFTILYVDDDHDDLMIIADAFEKYTDHLTVLHAHHGGEAMEILQALFEANKLPCLIILDINMPIMNGKETLKAIKTLKAFQNIPIVLFSTSSRADDKNFAHQWGADYLTKPSQYVELEKLVSHFAERCRLELHEDSNSAESVTDF